MLPDLFQAIKEKPSDFFGICKANEILTDTSKVLGISEAGLLFLPIENTLIGVQINAFLGTELVGLPAIPQADNPLGDIYESLGLPQYIQKEIFERKYLENLFSSEKIDEKTLDKFKALTKK
jgi:hypothetical protein